MKKLVYFVVVSLAFVGLQVATVEAQAPGVGMPGGPCDPGPACVENCCGQCDPGPACVMDDPNAIPCCGLDENDMSSGTPPTKRVCASRA